ncbi:alpha/beta hydrolase family protein [Gimesia aquarii]|uniref:Alpha/beta hydrolase family protein n=1 Tax=Gimesia aquarii TaxID=2527964 RepID=A0A517WNR0_9PLAN|nr:prolyl oligopeptidase family serine peptidase [Gimesia aquarii]QDU06902.1 Alpha/beta hydrolase family protein [Gimesia aquarii]
MSGSKQSIDQVEKLSRRTFLQSGGISLVSLSLFENLVLQELVAAPADQKIETLNRFPRMVQEYFVRRVREQEAKTIKRLDSLKTKADAEEYVQSVQKRIREAFGRNPERTPLNARITKTTERDTYRIENIIIESRPGFLVTANLYIPKGITKPVPGVVGTCGHSHNGKAETAYQSFAQGLARKGYVVLIYDPIGQGERIQYSGDDLKSTIGVGVREHLQGGNQQFLVGENLAMWRAWDGIRALDYLLTRKEVDPKQVGVTGNSGGGTMTTWLCGVEPRWTMAAPSCFVTTFRRNMENELPADTEQCPPKVLALELDHADFLAAQAPHPIRILSKERDYFDVRGAHEAYLRLKRLYKLLGKEENISFFIGPTYHGYSQENREAMYQWFNQATGASNESKEPKLIIEKDETLWCTPKGSVANVGSKPMHVFTAERSQELAKQRKPKSGAALKSVVAEALRLKHIDGVPDYRILRNRGGKNYPLKYSISYAVETEPGIQAVVYRVSDERLYSRPPQNTGKLATLYVAHISSDAELREEPLLKKASKEKESILYTCDVRGIGESLPDTTNANSFFTPYGSDYFYAAHAVMLDEPYIGQKTFDVLRVLEWLKANGHTEIHLIGRGWGALPATFAALFSPQVKQVTLKNALTSFSDIAETEHYHWPLSTLIPNVLTTFDMPDCYAELKVSKEFTQIAPWGAIGTDS